MSRHRLKKVANTNCINRSLFVNVSGASRNTNNKLKASTARLVACNGDCNSKIARIIDQCVNGRGVTDVTEANKAISESFWLHGYPLRQELISLLGKKELQYDNNGIYQRAYESLCDASFYIEGNHCDMIIKLLEKLVENSHIDILTDLANKSCLHPNYSISQEIESYYNRKIEKSSQEIATKTTILAGELSKINKDNCEQYIELIKKYNQDKTKLEDGICKLRQQSAILNEEQYQNKIEVIKQKPQYKEMVDKNMPLSNQEILAIMLYTDHDMFCREMRKSHRDSAKGNTLHSCHWKKLYHHLCCGLYKIWTILHEGNKRFYNNYIKGRKRLKQPNVLLCGMSGVGFANKHQKEYPLYTVTSFSSSFAVAENFAKPSGVILTIKDAYKAIYEGKLIAASVKWISVHDGEDEFILLPTVLKNFRFINKSKVSLHNDSAYLYPYDPKSISIYEASVYKPMDLKPVVYSISNRMKPPSMWLGRNIKHKAAYIKTLKIRAMAYVIMFGGFLNANCPICGVESRYCEYNGSVVDFTVECPSCRSLFLQFDDANPNEFYCHNLKCKEKNGKIQYKDLIKVNEDEKHEMDYKMGYKCRKCGKQQRMAKFESYQNEEFLDQEADRYIECVDIEFSGNVNFKRDKEKIKEMILFVMNPKERKTHFDDFLKKFFPVILGWIAQSPDFKIDAFQVIAGAITKKIGGADFVRKGVKEFENIFHGIFKKQSCHNLQSNVFHFKNDGNDKKKGGGAGEVYLIKDKLVIYAAIYGLADVTDIVRNKINRKTQSLTIRAVNTIFGDSWRGQSKTLIIVWGVRKDTGKNNIETTIMTEGKTMIINEKKFASKFIATNDNEKLNVLSAVYGLEDHSAMVQAKVKGRNLSIKASNGLFGDSWHGNKKSLVVVYRIGAVNSKNVMDGVNIKTVQEGETLNI